MCLKLGLFVWAENTKSTPIKEDIKQKERLKGKNGWQMRPNSIAMTVKRYELDKAG